MPRFKITIENVCFQDNPDIDGFELSPEDIATFNEKASSEGYYDDAVKALVDAHLSFDDNQGEDNIKTFISLTFEVEAASLEAAEEIEVSDDLADLVLEVLNEQAPDASLVAEDEWMQTESERA